MNQISLTTKLYIKARNHNWDYGYFDLYETLYNTNCDKGIALMMYWFSKPEYFTQYQLKSEVPEFLIENYDFVKEIESYFGEIEKEIIIYDPFEDDLVGLYKDLRVKLMIPKIMYDKTNGVVHFKELKG
ncbi:MAG: DUF4274 domain-containing protein [Saprospiraceae bacterium]